MQTEEPLQRAVAKGVATLGERGAQFFDGDVRRRLKQPLDQPALRLDAGGPAIAAEGTGPDVALATLQSPPSAHGRRADAEARGGLAAAGAVVHTV